MLKAEIKMNTNEIKIEKGVPLPPKKPTGNRRGRWVDVVRNMEIGDSVLLPGHAMTSIYAACKRNGWKVLVQVQPDNPNLRLWRVAMEGQI